VAEYGVVQEGFRRKRYQEILSDMQSRARANFGGTINTDTNKPFGKFLDIHAWELAMLWETAEHVYNCIAIDTASNAALDRIAKYKNIKRKMETFATSDSIKVSGTASTIIPSGFIVGKGDGTTYSTTSSAVIPLEGYALVFVECNYPGSRGNAEIGDVNAIITPITGIDSVTNIRAIVNGQDFEIDSVLRQRYKETVGGLSTVDSLRAAVMEVEGVVSTIVIENPSMAIDEYGNPPKSFQVFVHGGEDEDIAQAILASKAAGVQAYGTTIIEAIDMNGYSHEIGFTRANVIMIQVKVTITRDQFWPYDGVEQIKKNILEYIGGVGPDGTQYAGLKVNQSVVRNYINSAIWPVGGLVDVNVELAKEGEVLSDQNIIIGEFEIARTSFDIIEVVLQ